MTPSTLVPLRCYSVLILLSLLFYLMPVHADTESDETIEIYVNQSVPDERYSLSDIRAIFAMRKNYWPNGEKIQVFVLPDDHSIHRQFVKSKLNMFAHQLRRIWDRLIFSGIGQAPQRVNSHDEMINKIESVPSAIGYLKKQTDNKNIRIINYE